MALQTFWQASAVADFPEYRRDSVNNGKYGQLRTLYFSVPAQLLVGLFEVNTTDWEINTGPSVGVQYFGLFRLWRDGSRLQWDSDPENTPFTDSGLRNPKVASVDNGTIAWAPTSAGLTGHASPGDLIHLSAAAVLSQNYYRVNDIFPGDIHTGEILGSTALLSVSIGVLRPTRNIAYNLKRVTTSGIYTQIIETPAGTVRFSSITEASWKQPRDLLFIDGKTAAVVFAQTSGGAIATDLPSIIRVFDTTTSVWTYSFEDRLPGSANIATWDPINKIIYAIGRYESNSTLYACRLARAPTSVTAPTLVSVTELGALKATTVSVRVTDSFGSNISNYLVQWLLSGSVASHGTLASDYSLTNNSGIATITYVGPMNPPAGLTEIITARVRDVVG